MTRDPEWISKSLCLALHARQILFFQAEDGIRDEGLLESALARPMQSYAYNETTADIAQLAAALTFGIAKNHPFVDGNKRTAAVALELFIELNDLALHASDLEILDVMLALAEGKTSEAQLADWIRAHLGLPDHTSIMEPDPRYSMPR